MQKNTLILGRQGIGKSRFLLFVLYQLVKEDIASTILYSDPQGDYMLFTKDGIRELTIQEDRKVIRNIVKDPKCWWLMDGSEQGPFFSARCPIILTASPRESNYNEFKKNAKIFWMPEWDQDDELDESDEYDGVVYDKTGKFRELRALREHIYTNVEESYMLAALRHWGPVPRRVLQNIDKEFNLDVLHGYINASNVDVVKASVGTKSWSTEFSQSILRYRVSDDYKRKTDVNFASWYIATKFYEKHLANDAMAMAKFMKMTSGDPGTNSLRGRI